MANAAAILVCKWHPLLLDELLARTPDVYVVVDDADAAQLSSDMDLLAEPRGVYRVTSFDSVEELTGIAVDLSLRGVPVSRVVSHSELTQYGAGLLEHMLRGPADPLRFASYRDKRLMKHRVRAAGVRVAQSCSLTGPDDVAGAETAQAALRFPVVVKPAAGTGTVSTLRVEQAEDLAQALADFSLEPFLRSRQLIVEEFVSGRELCVDAIWSAGQALSFVVHAYYIPRLAVTAAALMMNPALNGSRIVLEDDEPDLYSELRVLHDKVNRALGIADGATHLEAFAGPDGEVTFSEVATRMGGAWVPRMLSSYFGTGVWSVIAEAMVSSRPVQPRPVRRYTGGLNVAPLRPGVITSTPSGAELAACPGVLDWQLLQRKGDKVDRFHPSEWSLLLVLGADSLAEYNDALEMVGRRFHIVTEPDRQPAA